MNSDVPARRGFSAIAVQDPTVSPAGYSAIFLLLVPTGRGAAAWAVQHGPLDLFAHRRETAGRCFASGHAVGGYALLFLFFAGLAAGRPNWRRIGRPVGTQSACVSAWCG